MAEPKNVIFKIQADTAQLRRELDAVKKSIDNVNNGVNGTAKNVSNLSNVLKGAAAAFGGIAIGQSIVDFGKNAIKAASDFETLQISFTTFLKSQDKAKTVLADLQQFSAATPFTGEEVQNAGRALLAFGEDSKNLIPVLERIGDISAGTGKNFNELAVIYGKARTQGTLFAEDINQLTEAGVPIIQEFAKNLGVGTENVKKLASEGKIGFKDLEKAFVTLTSNGGQFEGLTKTLGDSFAGRVSTLEDNFIKISRSVGQSLLPIFEVAVNGAIRAIEFLGRIPSIVEKNKVTFSLLAGAVALYAGYQLKAYIVTQLANKESLISIIRQKALTAAMVTGVNIQRIRTAAQIQGNIVQRGLAVGTEIATIAQQGFNAALKANPLGLLITALTLALTFMVDYGDATEDAANAQADANAETETFIDLKQAQKNIQEQTNANMASEITKLDQLFKQLKLTTNGSKERKQIIDQINSTYGTTLKNLSDEEKFVKQVDAAYKALTNQIKLKAAAEATSQQLTELYKQALNLQSNLSKLGTEGAESTYAALFGNVARSTIDQFASESQINTAIDEFYSRLSDKQKREFDILSKESKKQIATFTFTTTATDTRSEGQAFTNRERQRQQAIEAQKNAKQLKETLNSIDQIAQSSADLQQQLDKQKFDVSQVASVDDRTKNDTLNFFNDLKKQLVDLKNEQTRSQLEFNVQPLNFQETIAQLRKIQLDQERIIDLETERAKEDAKRNGTLTQQNENLIDQIATQKKLNLAIRTGQQISAEDYKEQLRLQKLKEDIQQNQFEQSQFIQQQLIEDINKTALELEDKFQKAKTKKQREAIQKQLNEIRQLQIEAEQKSSNERIQQIEQNRKREIENAKGDAKEIQLINAKADFDILKEKQKTTDKVNEISKDSTDKQTEEQKKLRDQQIENAQLIAKATIDLINQVIDARIKEADAAISAQERRIEQATAIAEKGNAEILQLETDRLDKLQKERAKFVRQQQALAFIEIATNSAIAIAKAAAEGGAAAPVTIAATLLALAAGFVSARAQAQAAGGFEKGGYTGDGGKSDVAGVVHKGEFVFTKEKTSKYRSLFEAIHKGRNPELALGVGEKIIVVNNGGMDEKLSRIETAIREQSRMNLSIDERGIHGLVSHYQFKENRIRNKAK